jgi:hypothetical protein
MAAMYCRLCRRPVEARRHIGLGTVILAVCTGGLWLVAIPFYSKRCFICGSASVSASAPVAGAAGGAVTVSAERLAELEKRLGFAEGELETTTAELDRVRTERDFYHKLLEDPARRKDRPGTA